MQTVREQLVEALEKAIDRFVELGACTEDDGALVRETGSCNHVSPECEGASELHRALDRARAEPASLPAGRQGHCNHDGPDCPGYQEGLEAQRGERVRK